MLHDTHALQSLCLVTERRAHAADLPVQSLREDHAERLLGRRASTRQGLVISPMIFTPPAIILSDRSVIGRSTVTRYSFSWLFSERRISLTMSPLLVNRIKPSESLSSRPTGNIRSRVADQIDDVVLDRAASRGAGHADGLVERDVDRLLGADRLAVDAHLVAVGDPGARARNGSVAGHAARLDPFVGLAARTDARFR